MIKIYIIISVSIFYANLIYATTNIVINSDENSLDQHKYIVKIIGNLIPDLYIFIITISILSGKYIDLLFLTIPLLYVLTFMIGEYGTFIKHFSHGLFTTCNKCNRVILYKNDHCNKCQEEFVKEQI